MKLQPSGAVALLILVLAAPTVAPAQSRASTVVGVVRPSPGADPEMAPILQDFFRFDLARRSIRFVEATGDDEALAALIETARRLGAAYAASALYSDTANEIELTLTLYDVPTQTRVSTATASGSVDLMLGTVVARVIDDVLATVVLAPDSMTEPTDPTVSTAATDSTRLGPETTAAAGVSQGALSVRPGPGSTVVQPAPRHRPIGLAVGAAPLILTGAAAAYGSVGILSGATFHGRLPLGPGSLALGVLTGFGWLRLTGVAAQGDLSLVPVGVHVVYTPLEHLPIGLSFHLSGGGAVLSLSTTYAGRRTKLVPYVLGGLEAGLALTPAFGLEVRAGFIAFLDGSLPITAFVPEVYLWLRL